MAEENNCAHKGCDCRVSDDEDYCSPQCEAAAKQDLTDIACDCGHPGCS